MVLMQLLLGYPVGLLVPVFIEAKTFEFRSWFLTGSFIHSWYCGTCHDEYGTKSAFEEDKAVEVGELHTISILRSGLVPIGFRCKLYRHIPTLALISMMDLQIRLLYMVIIYWHQFISWVFAILCSRDERKREVGFFRVLAGSHSIPKDCSSVFFL